MESTKLHTRGDGGTRLMNHLGALAVVLIISAMLGHTGSAEAEDGDVSPPKKKPVAKDTSKRDESTPPAIEGAGAIEVLPPVEVTAPRLLGGQASGQGEGAITATRNFVSVQDLPNSVSILTGDDVRLRRAARSLSDSLQGLPGVLVQKTGPLQHSPFIRGFTGYQNLMLVDGIRLNNSTFRAGPNQYWSTVDPFSLRRVEVVRGPHSVLYGSDAIGGTVNAIPWRRESFRRGTHWNGGVYTRYASAEDAVFGRVEVEGNHNNLGWAGGITTKRYGNITSGGGLLPGTGGVEEYDADLRLDLRLSRSWTLTGAYQRVRQFDAPRTERTVDSVPFHGTSVGSELRRDFDQERDLAYVKLAFDGGSRRLPVSRGHVAVSYHRQSEERDRLRTGDRRDVQGFDVSQLGLQAQMVSASRLGTWTYGAEWYHDSVDSFRRDSVGGVPGTPRIQGPIGDDASYDLLGVYVQNQIRRGRWEWIAGARFTYAAASADRVDNQAVAGTDPSTPGNVISVDNDWTNVVGSLRSIYHVSKRWNLYGGLSQGFRTPSLHDLTALDETSAVETPAPGLDPEKYVSFELGVKTEQDRIRGGISGWYTLLEDSIIRSPTGTLIGGTPEVRKDNIGDGYVWGVDLEWAWEFRRCWTWFGTLSYMDGEVDQFDAAGVLKLRPLSRMKPLSVWTGLRFEPRRGRFWAQADVEISDREDRLSLRDETDTRRIPPGGTPGWTVANLRAGYRFNRHASLSLALENITDENYRIHGSGQNEPGRSFVFALDLDF